MNNVSSGWGRVSAQVLVACAIGITAGCGPSNRDERLAARPSQALVSPIPVGVFDAEHLLDWAQDAYPQVFPRFPIRYTQELGPYLYRSYPQTGNYLGVSGYEVFVLGALSPGEIRRVGVLADYGCGTPATPCGSVVISPHVAVSHPHYRSSASDAYLPVSVVTPASTDAGPVPDRFARRESYAVADLNGDGRDDVLVAPSFFVSGPRQQLLVWSGFSNEWRFSDVSSETFDGPIPSVAAPANIITADFNGDGRLDVFIADEGLNARTCDPAVCPGSRNVLLLGQPGGKLKDVSGTNLQDNLERVHASASAGDANGDGLADIAVAARGGAYADGNGVLLWVNDGTGRFAQRSAALLPESIGYMSDALARSAADRQSASAVGLLDLDGDGVAELVTCSSRPDAGSQARTIRIHRWDAALGRLTEIHRIGIAARIEALAAAAGLGDQLACSGVTAGDLDGDGLQDLVISWDAGAQQYIQVLHRAGARAGFDDVTIHALGQYEASHGVRATMIRDINGDGKPDLLHIGGGPTLSMLAEGSPATFINGAGAVFAPQRLMGNSDFYAVGELRDLLSANPLQTFIPLYGRFVRTGTTDPDLLLVQSLGSNLVVLHLMYAGAPVPSETVYKYMSAATGGCGVSVPCATPLDVMKAQLAAALVGVIYGSCGYDGNAYPAVVGGPDGKIGIFDIRPEDLQRATAAGFAPVSNLPWAARTSCWW